MVTVYYPPNPFLGLASLPVRSGIVTLAEGQTARLIAVNTFSSPITLKMVFRDQTGAVLSQQTATVAPGTATAPFDFTNPLPTAPTTASATTGPIWIRYDVSLVAPSSPAMSFLANAEVFDSVTHATTVPFPPNPV